MKAVIWTSIPTHHQSGFFAALRRSGVDLLVRYYSHVPAARQALGWNTPENLPDGEEYCQVNWDAVLSIPDWRERIHVIPGYRTAFSRRLATELSRQAVTWVHWSECAHPGVRWWLSYPLKRWYARVVNKSALGAFAIGSMARDDFARWGIKREKIAFLHYAVPAGVFATAPDEACRNFRENRLAFLFLGSLCPRKGIDVLLRAFAQVPEARERAALLLVGDDRSHDAYSALARKLGLERVVFFRGAVEAGKIASVLKCAHVLVLPSRHDGWGVVLNEGASMGLALVGSDHAGASHHLIEPAVNGFMVKAGSVSSLAQALREYVLDPGLAERHGKESLRIFQDYTPERNAQRFISAIQEWQARHHTGQRL